MKVCFNLPTDMRELCFSAEAMEKLGGSAELKLPEATKKGLLEAVPDCEVMVTGWRSVKLDHEILEAAKNLKVILHSAGSIRGVESEELWERGIRITSAANVNAIPVAEFLLGMVLVALKKGFQFSTRFREEGRGAWKRNLPMQGYYKSVIGIIGMGNVGKHFLKLLRPFDFEVIVHSFYPFEKQATEAGVELVELDEIMRRSDAVVVAAPDIEKNRKMFDARRFSLMKDDAWFINAARGALVDEAALIAELETGRINAALDVTFPEPPVAGSPLYTLANCILTPHIAGSVETECLRLGDQVVKEFLQYTAGLPFENEISRELAQLIG